MAEFIPQEMLLLSSWVSCFIPKEFQEAALKKCEKEGIKKTASLTFASWECLEFSIKQGLEIFPLKAWIAKDYLPDEYENLITHLRSCGLDVDFEVHKSRWMEIKLSYEKITCR